MCTARRQRVWCHEIESILIPDDDGEEPGWSILCGRIAVITKNMEWDWRSVLVFVIKINPSRIRGGTFLRLLHNLATDEQVAVHIGAAFDFARRHRVGGVGVWLENILNNQLLWDWGQFEFDDDDDNTAMAGAGQRPIMKVIMVVGQGSELYMHS